MNHPLFSRRTTTAGRRRLHVGARSLPTAGVRWLINGFPATVLIWSEEEWEALEIRPSDAQYHPTGVWCALRME